MSQPEEPAPPPAHASGYGPPPQPPASGPYPGHGPYPGYGPPTGPWGWAPPPLPKGGSDRTGPLPLHPMTVSDILDGAFKLLKGNLRTVAIVAAVFLVPVQLVAAFVQRASGVPNLLRAFSDPTALQSSDSGDGSVIALSFVVIVLGLLVTPFIAGGISRVVSASYVGTEEVPAAALGATLRRTWPLLASWVMVHLLELIGGVFCFLPGLAAMTMFVVVAPAIVIEGLGPVQGMKRSWQLVKGRFWGTLGIALLAGMLSSVVSWALSTPFTIVGGVVGDFGWIVVSVGGLLAALVAEPFVAVVATLQYYDARIRTEGFDVQMLVAKLERGQ